jgi:hypothetical protein
LLVDLASEILLRVNASESGPDSQVNDKPTDRFKHTLKSATKSAPLKVWFVANIIEGVSACVNVLLVCLPVALA